MFILQGTSQLQWGAGIYNLFSMAALFYKWRLIACTPFFYISSSCISAVLLFFFWLLSTLACSLRGHACWTFIQILTASPSQCTLDFCSLRASPLCKLLEKKSYTFPSRKVCELPFCLCLVYDYFIMLGGGFFQVYNFRLITIYSLFYDVIEIISLSSNFCYFWNIIRCLSCFPLRVKHLYFLSLLTLMLLFTLLFPHPFLPAPSFPFSPFSPFFLPPFRKYCMFYLSVIFIDFFGV